MSSIICPILNIPRGSCGVFNAVPFWICNRNGDGIVRRSSHNVDSWRRLVRNTKDRANKNRYVPCLLLAQTLGCIVSIPGHESGLGRRYTIVNPCDKSGWYRRDKMKWAVECDSWASRSPRESGYWSRQARTMDRPGPSVLWSRRNIPMAKARETLRVCTFLISLSLSVSFLFAQDIFWTSLD